MKGRDEGWKNEGWRMEIKTNTRTLPEQAQEPLHDHEIRTRKSVHRYLSHASIVPLPTVSNLLTSSAPSVKIHAQLPKFHGGIVPYS